MPTDRALALGPEVSALLGRVDALGKRPGPFDPAALERTFSFGGADYMEILFLPQLVRRLAREAPRVDIASRVVQGDPEAALESGAIDLAFGVFGELSPRLVRRKLFEERFVCMLRKGHPALREPLTVERYAALPHVLISPRGSGPGAVDTALAKQRMHRRIAVRTSTFLAAPQIVEGTDCVVTMPALIAEVMSRGRAVVLVPPPLRVPGFTLSMAFHERSRSDPAHAWLRARMVEIGEAVMKDAKARD